MKIINNLPFGEKTIVVDDLKSTSQTSALSANQGNVLNTQYKDLKESIEWGAFK